MVWAWILAIPCLASYRHNFILLYFFMDRDTLRSNSAREELTSVRAKTRPTIIRYEPGETQIPKTVERC
jgi:hypothetical protein